MLPILLIYAADLAHKACANSFSFSFTYPPHVTVRLPFHIHPGNVLPLKTPVVYPSGNPLGVSLRSHRSRQISSLSPDPIANPDLLDPFLSTTRTTTRSQI
jgi:hypothetical protein